MFHCDLAHRQMHVFFEATALNMNMSMGWSINSSDGHRLIYLDTISYFIRR